MELLAAALKGFGVLSQHTAEVAGSFRAFTVAGYPSPGYSPVIRLAKEPPRPGELDVLRAHWHQQWGPTAPPPCYLVDSSNAPDAALLPRHWRQEKQPLRVIVEPAEPVAVRLQPLFTLDIMPLGRADTDTRFLRIVTACFPHSPEAPPQLALEPLRRARARSEIVTVSRLLQHAPAEPAAVIALTVKGDTAFLTHAAVLKQYRGMGLSRVIQRAASRRCHALGARTVVTVTRNPRIVTDDRTSLLMSIHRSDAPRV
ncbi:hypothetical protein ACWGII_18550 [Streptomyces sp. NPDC054855]